MPTTQHDNVDLYSTLSAINHRKSKKCARPIKEPVMRNDGNFSRELRLERSGWEDAVPFKCIATLGNICHKSLTTKRFCVGLVLGQRWKRWPVTQPTLIRVWICRGTSENLARGHPRKHEVFTQCWFNVGLASTRR